MSLLLLFKRLRSGLKVPFLATKRRQPRPRDIDTEPTERSWGRWTNPGHVHPIGPGARGVKAAPSGGGQPPKPSPAPKPPANPQKGGAKPAPAPRPAKPPTETPKGQEPAPAPTPAKSKLSQRKIPKPPKVKPPTMAAEPAPSPPPAPKPIPEAVPSADAGYVGGEDEHGSSAEAQPSSQQAVAANRLRPTAQTEEPLDEPVGNEPATRVGVHVPSGNRRPETKPVDVHLPKEEAERQAGRAHPEKGPGAEETPGETEPYKEVIDEIPDIMRRRFEYNRHGADSEESAWGDAVLHGEARGRQLLRAAGATPDEIEPILRRALDRAWDDRLREETRGEKIQPRKVRAMIVDKTWPMLKDYLLENVQDTSTLSAEDTNKRVNQAVNLIQYGDAPNVVINRLKRQLAGNQQPLTAPEEELVKRVVDQLNNSSIPSWQMDEANGSGPGPKAMLNPMRVRRLIEFRLDSTPGITDEQMTPGLIDRLAREAMSRIEPVNEENVFLAPAREDDEEESGATPLDQIDLSEYNLSPEDEEKVRKIIPGLTSFAQMIVDSYNAHHGMNTYPGYDQPTSYDHLESEMYRLLQYVLDQFRYSGIKRPRVGFGQDDLVNELIDIATDRIKLAPPRGDEEIEQVENPQAGQSKLQEFRDDAEVAEALRQWQEREPPAPPPDATHEQAEAWAAELRRWEQEKPRKQDSTPEGKKFVEKLRGNQKAHELTQKVSTSQMSRSQRLQLEKRLDDLQANWEKWTQELGEEGLEQEIYKVGIKLFEGLDGKSARAHKVLRESLKDTGAAWEAGDYFGLPLDPDGKGKKLSQEGNAFVNGMVAAPGIREYRLRVNTHAKKGRAHYDGTIHIDPRKDKPSDWVHEFGHHLELHVPGLSKLARDFLRHRVGDEEPVSLKELFPLRGFKDYETGREDDFDRAFGKEAHYVGKEYPDGQTEIISMGLEKMYSDPVGFAQMDPEYFAFMVGVMDGSLLKQEEPTEINPGQETLQGSLGNEEESGATPLDQIDLSEYNLSPEDEEKVREVMVVGTKRAQKMVDKHNRDFERGDHTYKSTYDWLADYIQDISSDAYVDLQTIGIRHPDEDLLNEIADIIADRLKLDLPEDLESSPKQAPAREEPRDVKVEFNDITEQQVSRRLGIYFGQPGRYVGAPDGSTVTVEPDPYKPSKTVVFLKGDGYESENIFFKDGRGRLVCYNQSFLVAEEKQGKGLGSQIFADQVQALRAAGFSRIDTRAAGGAEDPESNGHYTWPLLGYDGPLEPRHLEMMPPELKTANPKTIQDLFSLPGGPQWWLKNGEEMNLSFDLTPGSRSLRVLQRYLTRKRMNSSRETPPEAGRGVEKTGPQAPARGDEVTADDLSDWIGNG